MTWRIASSRRFCRPLWTLAVAVFVGAFGRGIGFEQSCGTDYTIKEGQTLAQIAARVYGNPAQWTVIFYANQDRLGDNVSMLVPGLALQAAVHRRDAAAHGAAAGGDHARPDPARDRLHHLLAGA